MAYLHDGSVYQPGQGRRMAEALRDRDLDPDVLARYFDDFLARYVTSDYAEGYGTDVVVADLIVRGLLNDRRVALALVLWGEHRDGAHTGDYYADGCPTCDTEGWSQPL